MATVQTVTQKVVTAVTHPIETAKTVYAGAKEAVTNVITSAPSMPPTETQIPADYVWRYTSSNSGYAYRQSSGNVTNVPSARESDADAVTGTISVTPSAILTGESATLSWEIHMYEIDAVSINGTLAVQPTGSLTVTPPQTTTYTVSANGKDKNGKILTATYSVILVVAQTN
jgi:hypothetical protein